MSFVLERHPRAFNKSIACKSGLHVWGTGAIMGIPVMVCTKCGSTVMKSVLEHTLQDRDYRKFTPREKPKKESTLDIVEQLWEEKQRSPRR